MFGKLMCTFGRHSWQRRHNPDVGGAESVYFICTRCGKEKPGYGPPSSGQATGMAWL